MLEIMVIPSGKVPSGQRLQKNIYGKIRHLAWENSRTFDWAIFNSKLLNVNISSVQPTWGDPKNATRDQQLLVNASGFTTIDACINEHLDGTSMVS